MTSGRVIKGTSPTPVALAGMEDDLTVLMVVVRDSKDFKSEMML